MNSLATQASDLLHEAAITAPELARDLGWFSQALCVVELDRH